MNNQKLYRKLVKSIEKISILSEREIELIHSNFKIKTYKNKEYLLGENKICDFIGFITEGIIKHVHVNDGIERTCDVSFEDDWFTNYISFNSGEVSNISFQALEDTVVLSVTKEDLNDLYRKSQTLEKFGRIMAEKIAQKSIELAISLSSENPEVRFKKLLKTKPNLFQIIPQKHIADILGISPESLSRMRKRIALKEKS